MPDPAAREKEQCWRRRTGLEKKLIFGASALGVFALVLLLVFYFQKSCDEPQEECNTKSCVKAAAEILEFVDLKADPCHNFYKFACGSFVKNAVKKDNPSPWESTRTLFENEMKALVVDPISVNDTNTHVSMKKFYRECMNTTKIEDDENETFMNALNELGGWPMINGSDWKGSDFNWAEWYIKAKKMGLPALGLFHFTKLSPGILRVGGPNLEVVHYNSKSTFRKLMRGISEAFSAPEESDDYNQLFKLVDTFYDHRYELHTMFDDDDEHEIDDDEEQEANDDDDDDVEETTEPKTIANLTELCPNVPWLHILNNISGNSSQFDDSSKVFYSNSLMEKYCLKLDSLLKDVKPEVFANFYIWTIITNAHKYMTKDVRRVYEDIESEESDRFQVCYDSIDESFKYVKETVYIRRKTFPKVRNDLFEMIRIIKELFIERLKKCDWMDATSKAKAIKKAKAIEHMVGADDFLYDVEKFDRILGFDNFNFTSDNIFRMYMELLLKQDHTFFAKLDEDDEDDWPSFFDNAVEVNAFFLPSANAMIIPAPILTSIFYNWKFPAFMNYGAMGSTVGHELTHGFTQSSREFEGEDWWTNTTEERYTKKIKCIIDEYESIPFRYRLNGTMTLEENIADFVGADVGYEAYKTWVNTHSPEKKLAGVPLTPEQIYWVQTATNFCFRKLDDNSVDYEEKDEHGIPAFRVQGPARHSLHFAEAFNCPVGSFMNPKEKCVIL